MAETQSRHGIAHGGQRQSRSTFDRADGRRPKRHGPSTEIPNAVSTANRGLNSNQPDQNQIAPVIKKAGCLQVARTVFWGLFMIGRKGTWEKDGAVVSLPQILVGAFIGLILVLAILIGIVRMVLR